MGDDTSGLRIIDARNLEPPEPFVRAMEALDTLADGEVLRLLLIREPFPLYSVLEDNGFDYETQIDPQGTVEVRIRRLG